MRIAQIAPLNVSVPPFRYGGTELIVSLLTEELVKRGHDVTLYATGDSRTSAKLKSYFPHAIGFDGDDSALHQAAADFAFQDANDFDIIHNHASLWGVKKAKETKTPVVTTLHNDFILPKSPDFDDFKDTGYYVAISNNQRERLQGLNFAGMVYNAIESDKYILQEKKSDYLLFFGNLIQEKGVDTAIKAAKELSL